MALRQLVLATCARVLVGGLDQVLADAGRGRLDRRAGAAVLICS